MGRKNTVISDVHKGWPMGTIGLRLGYLTLAGSNNERVSNINPLTAMHPVYPN